jgi:hypothetical protein
MMQEKIVLSVADVQHALGIGKNKAYLLFKQPSFPSFQIAGKYMVSVKDFEIWMERIKKLPGKNYKLDSLFNS